MKPNPNPLPGDLRALALATMRDAKFPLLASVDGVQPRARPISPVRTDEFVVYVASMRSSSKTAELDRNPRVELCYMAENHDQVRITGIAEQVRNQQLIEDIWASNPLLRAYLGAPSNPEFMLYRIVPNRVRFMREWALEYHEVDFQ